MGEEQKMQKSDSNEQAFVIHYPLSYLHPSLYAKSEGVSFGFAGIYAKEDISKGTILVFWAGRIVDEQQLLELSEDIDSYTLQVDEHLFQAPIVDNQREAADFVNHSCNPNGGFASPVSLVAMRDVLAGEEVTFDYAMCESYDQHGEFECKCNQLNCREKFTGNDWKIPELQERYKGYFSPYLQRKIDTLQEEQP